MPCPQRSELHGCLGLDAGQSWLINDGLSDIVAVSTVAMLLFMSRANNKASECRQVELLTWTFGHVLYSSSLQPLSHVSNFSRKRSSWRPTRLASAQSLLSQWSRWQRARESRIVTTSLLVLCWCMARFTTRAFPTIHLIFLTTPNVSHCSSDVNTGPARP